MPHPFFGVDRYPWPRSEAKTFHAKLYKTIAQPAAIDLLYQQAGDDLDPLFLQTNPNAIWREVLDKLAAAHAVHELCKLILDKAAYKAVHAAAQALIDLNDPLDEVVLSDERVFIDRQALREKLQRIAASSSYRVLLVRGESGSGKSWTQYMVENMAGAMGERCIVLFEDSVKNMDEVLDKLFTPLGGEPPPRMETEDAWFRKICVKLQPLGEKQGRLTWIVVDDLGVDETGPRLDPQIRQFFDHFALQLGDFELAKWFRLVLIDYPEIRGGRGVPTKWRAIWDEDRPDPAHVDVKAVTKFVQEWAKRKKKKIGATEAEKFATDVITAVDGTPDPSTPRLERIHNAIVKALPTL